MSEPNTRPAIAQAPISVILQAHALSTETQDALRAWQQYLRTLQRPCEILLLQETRPEAPPSSAAQAPAGEMWERTFFYERTLGHRDALNEAIRVARYPLIAFCSCDMQYQPGELAHMLKVIDQVDLVVGFRVGKSIPFWRLCLDTVLIFSSRILIGVPLAPTACWLGSQGWGRRWLARWIFGLRVNDPECPFRLARRTLFERLPLQSHGAFVQIEILAKANHLTCLIAEEPVTWTQPTLALHEAVSFSDDAWRVFHEPEFAKPTPAIITMSPGQTPGTT